MSTFIGFESGVNIVGYGGSDEYNQPQFEPSMAITIRPYLSALKF